MDKPPGVRVGSRLIDLPGDPDPDAPPDPPASPPAPYEIPSLPVTYTCHIFKTNDEVVQLNRPSDIPLDQMLAKLKEQPVTPELHQLVRKRTLEWFIDAISVEPRRVWFHTGLINGILDVQIHPIRYTHPCEECEYLGNYEREADVHIPNRVYDLYTCAADGERIFTARYGNGITEVMSCTEEQVATSGFDIWVEAYHRWKGPGNGFEIHPISQY